MDFLLRQKQLFDRQRTTEIFSTLAFDEETELFLCDGNDEKAYVAAVWLCHPLPGVTEDAVSILSSALSNDIPNETLLTINLVSSTYVNPMLNLYHQSRRSTMNNLFEPEKAALVRDMVDNRLDMMRGAMTKPLDSDSKVLLKDKYVLITLKFEIPNNPTPADLEKVKPFTIAFRQSLDSLNMHPQQINHEQFLLLMRSILYPGVKPHEGIDEHTTLNQQIFDYDTDIEVTQDHVKVGETYFCSLSVQQFPKSTSLPLMSHLLGDPRGSSSQISSDYMLSTHIYFPDVHKTKQAIEKNARTIRLQNLGKIGRLVPKIAIKDENYSKLTNAMELGGRPVKVWTNLIVSEKDKNELVRKSSNAKNFYEVHGYKLSMDKYVQGPCWQLQLPTSITPTAVQMVQRFCTMTTKEACHLVPIVSDWKGNGIGANNIFYSRRGQVILFDPFDTDTNMNGCVFGESGSGKSVLANDIAFGVYSRGGIVRIIDSGRSYEKLTEQIGGEFIEFSPEKNIIINPFTNITNINQELPALCIILEQMAAPKSGLTDHQISELQRLTLAMFNEYGTDLNITILSECIIRTGKKEDKLDVIEMGEQLFPYTRHGPFGRYFDGHANLSMSGDWSVLELDDLADMVELRTIVLLMLITKLNKDFYLGDRQIKKLLLVDEYWKFKLDEDIGAERIQKFLVGAFRLFRKFNAATLICTQAVTDITKDGDSPLLGNAANIVVMKQKRESIDALQKNSVLSLDDQTFDLLRTVGRKGSEYSDLFIYTSGRGYGIARFVIDRFTQLLYSTNAQEVSKINKLVSTGKTVPEAIKLIIAEEVSSKAA